MPQRGHHQAAHAGHIGGKSPCPRQIRAVPAPHVGGKQQPVLPGGSLTADHTLGQGAFLLAAGRQPQQKTFRPAHILVPAVLVPPARCGGRFVQDLRQILLVEFGLEDILRRSLLQRPARIVKILVAGKHDHTGGAYFLHPPHHLQPIHAGHLDIGDHDVRLFPPVDLQRLLPAGSRAAYRKAFDTVHAVLQPLADGRLVVHN